MGCIGLAVGLCIGIWDLYERAMVYLVNQDNKKILRDHGFFKTRRETAHEVESRENPNQPTEGLTASNSSLAPL